MTTISNQLLQGRLGSFLNWEPGAPPPAAQPKPEMDATAWRNAAVGFALAQGVASAIAGYEAAQTQKSSLKTQAAMRRTNAKLSELQAQQTFQAVQKQIGAITAKAGKVKARQRAAFAANGLAIGTGSTAEIAASTDINKEVDVLQAKSNAVATAWGFRSQAAIQAAQARGADVMAKAATKSGGGAVGSSLLSAATMVAGMYYGGGAGG